MSRSDLFKIKEKSIYGIKNPTIHVHLICNTDDYKFEVICDGKEIEYNVTKINGNKEVIITGEIPVNSKKIIVKMNTEKNKILICNLNNSIFKRILGKIKGLTRKIFSKIKVTLFILKRGIKFLWREHHFLVPPILWKKYLNALIYKIKHGGKYLFYNPFDKKEYNKWLEENKEEIVYKKLNYNPLISIVIPVYNVSSNLLCECLDSILNQKYTNFEICLADDCSTEKETIETLKKYEKSDKRIKVVYRKENGHISKASNSALEIATGEFVAMMDNDDVIPENALYEMVKVLNKNKKIDFIYTDEDKLDLEGTRCDPNFKPDYSPESLLSSNYFCHFTLLRTSILKEIGGWKVGYEGAQDYDLFLRFVEKTTPDKIYHLPKILYHWRMVEGSTSMTIDNKGYAIERGKKAIEDALKRRKIPGIVHVHEKVPYYWVEYLFKSNPLISIIIPTKDYADVLEPCLKSIYEKTTYENYEVIVVNNNSEKQATFDLLDKYKEKYKNFTVVDANFEFNYSKINNIAVEKAKGEYIVLLNNDTEVITPNWLELMLGYASQKHIGTVGAKLIYPDKTVQHCGVILGIGGVAAHAGVDCLYDDPGMYGRLSVPYNYSAVTAACLMISKKKYQQVKGLNENLKVAFNDVDFNIRVLKKGYYNVCLPMVELYHYESKSRGLDTTTEKYKRFLNEVDFMHSTWEHELKHDKFYNQNFSLGKDFMLDKEKGQNL